MSCARSIVPSTEILSLEVDRCVDTFGLGLILAYPEILVMLSLVSRRLFVCTMRETRSAEQ